MATKAKGRVAKAAKGSGTRAKKAATGRRTARAGTARGGAARSAVTAAPGKYDQPGAPWWKKLPLPMPK